MAVCLLFAETALAATTVRMKPDRQVRPGITIPVWGSAGNTAGGVHGDGSANGETYTWSFSSNLNVVVTDDGSLTGAVGPDSYIAEEVSFALINGSTREVVTATLTVGANSQTVQLDIVSTSDPISDTPLESLTVNVNISIEDGLRAMYLAQEAGGEWDWRDGENWPSRECGVAGFTVWSFANSGHGPLAGTIYSQSAQRGINYILNQATFFDPASQSGSHAAFDPDGDLNGRAINLCPLVRSGQGRKENYSSPVAAAAIIASFSDVPTTAVPSGVQFAGETYFQIVQDAVDFSAFGQSDLSNGHRGGWNYTANSGGDTSVDSWNYLAAEGFESAFGGTVLEIVKAEAERRLDNSQVTSPVGSFTYAPGNLIPGGNGSQARTAGGLSGLVMVTGGGRTPVFLNPPGAGSTATFPNAATRIAKAVAHLGSVWDESAGTWKGNRNNFYAMWTTARALRLNSTTTLVNGGVSFDWTTGEENGTGNVPAADATRERYFPFLVRKQASNGHWNGDIIATTWTTNLNTAWGVLILQPTVFGPPPTVDAGTDVTVFADALCAASVTLTAIPDFDQNPALNYTWSGTGALSSTTNPATFSFSTAGQFVFTVTATDPLTGASASDSVVVTVVDNTPPTLTVAGASLECTDPDGADANADGRRERLQPADHDGARIALHCSLSASSPWCAPG